MKYLFILLFLVSCTFEVKAADTNTVSSTVVTNNTPPTANSPALNIVNSDICKTGVSGAVQTQIVGIAGGTHVRDMNCEKLKLSKKNKSF